MTLHLKNLIEIVDEDRHVIYPCIHELVLKGLVISRFTENDTPANRQDATQFIAAWFRHIGQPADICQAWLIAYSTEMLSGISTSSVSRIVHSTKSNVKYIYRSEVNFECGCEKNILKAVCRKDCLIYDEMKRRHVARIEADERKTASLLAAASAPETEKKVAPPVLTKREQYVKQFERAMDMADELLYDKVPRNEIVKRLNEAGFKTRTGRLWTLSILSNELGKRFSF